MGSAGRGTLLPHSPRDDDNRRRTNMPDAYYRAAKVPQETLTLIEALSDEAMRDVVITALHKRHRELSKLYDAPIPKTIDPKDWSAGRAYRAAIEKEADTIKKAARDNGFGGCHNPPMNCRNGCWFDLPLFGR